VEAGGELDEATSALGLARALARDQMVQRQIRELQRDLCVVMAELASASSGGAAEAARIEPGHVRRLDESVSDLLKSTSLPVGFILPGKTASSAAIDVARAILRRAERRVAKLHDEGLVGNPELLRYLNRASTLAYLLARREEQAQGGGYDLADEQEDL